MADLQRPDHTDRIPGFEYFPLAAGSHAARKHVFPKLLPRLHAPLHTMPSVSRASWYRAWRSLRLRLASQAVTSPLNHHRSFLGAAARVVLCAATLTCSVFPAHAQTQPVDTAAQTSATHKANAAPDASGAPKESSDTDVAFEAGVAAYRRGDYAAARDAFTLAYERDPSYRTAAVLGQTEEKLGHLPQAATLLNWAMFHLDPNVEPDAKARIQADLAILKQRVFTLNLDTPVEFEEVLIDDLVFTTNSLRLLTEEANKWTIYLEPAKHDVTVRSKGYHPQQRQVDGAAGQLLDWELRWTPLTPPAIQTSKHPAVVAHPGNGVAKAPSHRADPSRKWQLPVAIATGGLALVAAGFGFYSLHEYNAATDRFDTAKATLRGANLAQPCGATAPVSTRNACQAVAAADHDVVTHGNRSIATFTAAGALALRARFALGYGTRRD